MFATRIRHPQAVSDAESAITRPDLEGFPRLTNESGNNPSTAMCLYGSESWYVFASGAGSGNSELRTGVAGSTRERFAGRPASWSGERGLVSGMVREMTDRWLKVKVVETRTTFSEMTRASEAEDRLPRVSIHPLLMSDSQDMALVPPPPSIATESSCSHAVPLFVSAIDTGRRTPGNCA
jgi:hypothetical protein